MLVAGLGFGGFLFHFGILEDTPPTLSSQTSRLHMLHQKRSRPELLAQGLVQIFEDMQPRVESYQIDELKWTHGVVESQFQSLIDILRRGDPLLQHVKRLIADHGIYAAGNESG